MKNIAFIDAGSMRPNVLQKRLKFGDDQKIDWGRFISWANCHIGSLFDIHYFDGIPKKPSSGLTEFHRFLQQELKMQLHFTPLKSASIHCPACNETIQLQEQKGVDVRIALSMYKLSDHYDQAILIAGDDDLSEVINVIRTECGKRVIVVGCRDSIGQRLRDIANDIIVIDDYMENFIVPV